MKTRLVAACLAFFAAALWAGPWPSDARLSGNAFLPASLQALQQDPSANPIALFLDRGQFLWTDASQGPSCASCHGPVDKLREAAAHYPHLSANGKSLRNLEDQIVVCRARGRASREGLDSEPVLALSALLHDAAKGQRLQMAAPSGQETPWRVRVEHGAALYATRMGRMNLACTHCHDQSIGRQMRADVVSPAHPTGFPIYRMSWQGLGSIDRRLRACYSGVQAVMPPAGDPDLRDLELFLKVRAQGLALDGPSIRR